MSSPSSDIEPSAAGRPTRRSAAAASKQAWKALMPHKKGAASEEEDDGSDSYTPERPTPRGRKRGAQSQGAGQRKRVRTPKTPKVVVEKGEANEDDEPAPPKPTGRARKVLAPHQTSKQTPTAESRKYAGESPAVATMKTADALPTRQPVKSSPAKSPQKSAASPQKSASPQKTASAGSPAAQPTSQPLVIRPKASILGKRATILASREETTADGITSAAQRTHQQTLLKSGAGAMSKEELEEIEREVQKHGFDDPSGGSGDAKRQRDGSHESEDADEYPAGPPAKPRPNLTGRGSPQGRVPRGTPGTRGGRGSRGGRTGTGRPRGSRANAANPPAGSESGEYRAAGSVVGPAIMRDPSRPLMGPGPSGTVKVLRIRQNGAGGNPRGGSILMSSAGGPPRASSASLGSYLPMYASLNREVNELAQRYGDRVVSGTAVQEFNGIVDDVMQELNRVIDEKMRMRDWMDQVATARAAENEMKDKKIQELEYTVELLQSKLMVAMKRIQLNALKHDTAGRSAAGAASKSVDTEPRPATGESDDSKPTTDSGGGPPAAPSEESTESRQQPAPCVNAPRPQPLQKFVAPSSVGMIRPRANPFRYYDEDRDGEEDEPEEGSETLKSGGRIVGLPVSGPGGGSIFKSAGSRDMPMSLNAMNGRRVMMPGFASGRQYPPQRFHGSEDGFEEDDEDAEMDEEEEEVLALTASERRNLANLASRNGGVLIKSSGGLPTENGRPVAAEDSVESMPIGAEELVDGSEVGANQTVL